MSFIRTPEGILSYPHLFKPQTAIQEGDKEKFSATLVFPEGTDLTEMKKAVLACAEERWPGKASAMIKSGKLRLPFRTDWEDKGYPANSVFITARTTAKPMVVSTVPGPDGRPLLIEDPDQIYPGCRARITVKPFAYDTAGNRGISLVLQNAQKTGEGDRLDGRVDARDQFTADPNAAATLEPVNVGGGEDPLADLY